MEVRRYIDERKPQHLSHHQLTVDGTDAKIQANLIKTHKKGTTGGEMGEDLEPKATNLRTGKNW